MSQRILAIDPGPFRSAVVDMEDGVILSAFMADNLKLAESLRDGAKNEGCKLVIEKMESFGMPVGVEVLETVWWSGIFAASYGLEFTHRRSRKQVKSHLCGSTKAKDSNVRMALIDRYGGEAVAKGRKACPGPLHGISSHLWSAVAVAVTFADTHEVVVGK